MSTPLGRLRKATGVPLAAGENATGALEFVRLAAAGIDYLQPSAVKNGITAQWDICRRAEASGATCVPHSPYFGPGYLATLAHPGRQAEGGRAGALLLRSRPRAVWRERADRERLGEDPRQAGSRPRSGRGIDALQCVRAGKGAGAMCRLAARRPIPARIDEEIAKWTRIIQTANIKPTEQPGESQMSVERHGVRPAHEPGRHPRQYRLSGRRGRRNASARA